MHRSAAVADRGRGLLLAAGVLACASAGTRAPDSERPVAIASERASAPSSGPIAAETVCRYPLTVDRASEAGWPVLGGSPSGPWLARARVLGRVSGELVVARRADATAMWASIDRGHSRVEGWVRPDSLSLSPTRAIALNETAYLVGSTRLAISANADATIGIAVARPVTMRDGELRTTVPCAWLTADAHPVLTVDLDVPRPVSERVLRTGVPIEFRATPEATPSSTLELTDLAVAAIVEPGAKRTRVVVRDRGAGLAFVGWVDNGVLGDPFVGGLGLVATGRDSAADRYAHDASCVQPVDLVAELDGRRWHLGRLGASEPLEADAPDLALAAVRTAWLRPIEGARLRLAAQREGDCRAERGPAAPKTP